MSLASSYVTFGGEEEEEEEEKKSEESKVKACLSMQFKTSEGDDIGFDLSSSQFRAMMGDLKEIDALIHSDV